MNKVRIILDSTCDIMPEDREKFLTVPLTVHFGDREYQDGVTITHRQFYEMLVESDVMPKTSQPSPEAFAQVYRQVRDQGDTAVVITVSSGLSGTCQSARIAAEEVPGVAWVVDSGTVAIAAGILGEYALQQAENGMTAPELAAHLEEMKHKVVVLALLDTLEYLKKGGRLSATAAFAGGLLAIKPVITVREGKVQVLGKARGSRQGNNLLATEIKKAGGVDFSKPVLLGYTGLSDALLMKYIEDSGALWKTQVDRLRCTTVGSAIGTHAGPGAVAVAFFKR